MSTGEIGMDVDIQAQQIVVTLAESCELAHAIALHGALIEHAGDPRPLVVDWCRTERFHAAGLQVLLAAARDRQARGHEFQVTSPPPGLRAWLSSIGADAWVAGWVMPATAPEDSHE